MTDEEKVEWFDKTMEWFDQWDTPEQAIEFADGCSDAPYDLFFDMVEQYRKWKGSK